MRALATYYSEFYNFPTPTLASNNNYLKFGDNEYRFFFECVLSKGCFKYSRGTCACTQILHYYTKYDNIPNLIHVNRIFCLEFMN